MKKFKLIVSILFYIFIAVTAILILNLNTYIDRVFPSATDTVQFLNYVRIWAIVGFVIIVTQWVIDHIYIQKQKNRISRLEKENLSLKAQMFDQEEKYKKKDRGTNQKLIEEKEENKEKDV